MALLTLAGLTFLAPLRADPVADYYEQARTALRRNKLDQALLFAQKAIVLNDRRADLFALRGEIFVRFRDPSKAVQDFDKALALDPKLTEVYDQRGSEQFKLGNVREALADFDKYLELRPDRRPNHWRRGIALYELGRYEDGAKQFAAYENVDNNDVENAIWHYLCNAKVVGAEKARTQLLKIGLDRRVPLMTVYELFAGRAKPGDVLAAAGGGHGENMFFAHLYLGLYYESAGDLTRAKEHLSKAAGEFAVGEYMGDVAKVHLKLLKNKNP
jgi:lipoprotein NlpI